MQENQFLKDLFIMLNSNINNEGIDIEFLEEIKYIEAYPELKMKATIKSIEYCADDNNIAKVNFDYLKFEEHNRQFESSNYYDKDSNPTLNAKEAGYYNSNEDIYIDINLLSSLFKIIKENDNSKKLYNEFLLKHNNDDSSYILWLEESLLFARNTNKKNDNTKIFSL